MKCVDYITPLLSYFPDITEFNTRQTSPATTEYNCIAWACGKNNVCFWPDRRQLYSWPIPRRENSISAFEDLFSSIGYVRCADASKEAGFLKIAIYADKRGKPTHAARQLKTGKWTSKLGEYIDIEHDSPEVLNGPKYGVAKVFMKKKCSPCSFLLAFKQRITRLWAFLVKISPALTPPSRFYGETRPEL